MIWVQTQLLAATTDIIHQKFLEQLKATLTKIIIKKNRGKQIILCGDFNYNLLSHENGEYVGEFPNIMYLNFLQSCITEPTRIIAMIRDQV